MDQAPRPERHPELARPVLPRCPPSSPTPSPSSATQNPWTDSTSTHTGGKAITVTLASDVTFASDSADLVSGAETQLRTVAGQLRQHPDSGSLTIVGHTDDIQDDTYNQNLSEKRTNAVKIRLQQLTSLDKWKTSVSGKGESEPKVRDATSGTPPTRPTPPTDESRSP